MSVNMLMVACQFCGAAVGEHCTKSGMPGKCREQLTSIAGHPSRIAAAVAAGYSEGEARMLATAAANGQARRVRTAWAKIPAD